MTLLDTVTAAELRSASLLTGMTMAGFLAASLYRRRARQIRLGIVLCYVLGVVGFFVYCLL